MPAIEILNNLFKIAASPGGLAILERLFSEGGITVEKTAEILTTLPKPIALPGDILP